MSSDERQGKRKLKVDMHGLEMAFDNTASELSYYLDLQTGEVLLVSDETRRTLEEIYEELPEEKDQAEAGFDAAVSRRDLPDWMKEGLRTADMVESRYGDRFISIPRSESWQGYNDMEDFIETVDDRSLERRLSDAIQDKGAFRRFKDVLRSHSGEEERWFRFKQEKLRERLLEWLEEEGIEPESGWG